ncbi:MAG: hypothetical protein KatS3mg122_3345 [Caldimonas sp.]|nr:MAG: hypothetical protein KatS3mg122_3345 [Caldimonas sp.]
MKFLSHSLVNEIRYDAEKNLIGTLFTCTSELLKLSPYMFWRVSPTTMMNRPAFPGGSKP